LGFCGSFRRLCKLNAAEYRWGSEWESGLLPKMMSFIAARQLSLLIHTVFLQQLIAFDMVFQPIGWQNACTLIYPHRQPFVTRKAFNKFSIVHNFHQIECLPGSHCLAGQSETRSIMTWQK